MKRILLFIFILGSLQGVGQGVSIGKGRTDLHRWFDNAGRYTPLPIPPGYTRIAARYEWIAGYFDTALHLPGYNGVPTGNRTGSWVGDGAIAMDTTTGTIYGRFNGTWVAAGGSTPGLQGVITQDPVLTQADNTISRVGKDTRLMFQQDMSTSGGGSEPALWVVQNISSTAAPGDEEVGRFDMNISGTGTVGGGNAAGVVTALSIGAGKNIGVYSGFRMAQFSVPATSSVSIFEGISIDGSNNAGTVTDWYGFYYGGYQNTGAGTTTNHYGLWIDTLIATGTTNNYAIYTKNGSVRLGALPTGAATDSILTYDNALGIVRKRNVASITGVNIYNSDGTITGDRTVTGAGFNLILNNANSVSFRSTGSAGLRTTAGSQSNDITTLPTAAQITADGLNKLSSVVANQDSVLIQYTNDNRDSLSEIVVKATEIKLRPGYGKLFIDTLTFVPGTKALRYNPATGLVSYADTSTAAGGGTPAGNYGNLQINRNGAFATPGSDSLDFDGGLVVKGNVTSSTLTDGRVLIGGASGLIRDYAALTYDGMNLLNTTTGGASTGITITSTNASSYSSMNFVTTLGGNGFQIGKYGPTGSVANGVFFYNPDNSPTVFTQNNNRILDITGAGNLLLGGTTDPASAYYTIGLHNGGAPTGSITNGVIIYSEDVAASAELKVRDEAGNITVLSPHNFTGIPMGKSEDMAWSYYSERDGKYITVDMLKAIRTIEKLTVRVAELEKRLGVEPTKPTKLVYKGKVKVKQPVPINKNK